MKNLTEKQKKTLGLVVESGISENFYLAGRTTVALKYSHRYLEVKNFFIKEIKRHLKEPPIKEKLS